ncbi:MAG: sulfotransferase family protein [Pseudomonadota bacterium]
MPLEIVGAGFGRTGTLSLKFALEKLGFGPCYHMMEVHKNEGHEALWTAAADGQTMDWASLFQDYRAAVDWPSCNWWREQLAAFPRASVILSHRDPDAWYRSVMNTIYAHSCAGRDSDDGRRRAAAAMAFEVIWDGVFDGRLDDRDHVIDCFLRHNQAVRETVPAAQLLEYQPGDGWEPLCAFLEVPVPDEPYPRVNSTAEFNSHANRFVERPSDS